MCLFAVQIAVWADTIELISEIQKAQGFLFFQSPVTPDFEVIAVHLFSPLGNSDPACSSLTFIHIPLEIHPSVFFHSPPSCSHSPTVCEFCHPDAPWKGLHLLLAIRFPVVSISIPKPSHTLLENGSFQYLSWKRKPKRLSISFCWAMRIMVSPNE